MISVHTNPFCDRKRYEPAFVGGEIDIRFLIEQHHQLRRFRHQEQYGGDWAHIGEDLLEYILKKLPLADVLRCRGVCSWWRCVTKTYLSISINSLPKPYPPLIIWEKDFNGDDDVSWCFFDVLNKTDGDGGGGNLYLPSRKSQELLAQMAYCVGSSDGGYFLFKDGASGNTLYLFHPLLFSGSALHLPVTGDPSQTYGFLKAVLWGDPISLTSSCSYYGLVVLHFGYRAPLFAKCGDTQFNQLECRAKDDFVDIICAKDCVYGITKSFNLNVWDCTSCNGSNSIPRLVMDFETKFSTPHPPSCRAALYLMETEEEILLVVINRPTRRHLDYRGGTLASYNKVFPICEVYKMHFDNKEWVRIYSLGDRVLFLTHCQSMSLSSHEFPQYQRNSIYYWQYLPALSKELSLGLFNMEDGSLKLIHPKLG